ncbi:cell wall hydrolase [Bacillaceae bacterium Marseille-Q3522]|nr:cell wall hydrolase [Bacillaceae bacterium Marseille-Q3522]
MAVIAHTEPEVRLLARLMRAEAEGDGNQAMLLVGNVGVNRVLGNCLDFRGIRSIQQMVYQSPGGFEAVQRRYFYQAARQNEINLARKVIKGLKFHPAGNSLWFFEPPGACPPQWFNQWNTGRFKSHCFYSPSQANCPAVF